MEPKRIVRADTLSKPAGPKLEELVAPPAPEEKPRCWKFAKLFVVGQELVFKDGTKFKFPLRQRQDMTFGSSSEVVIEDVKLAENLRGLPPGFGVIEVKV